MELPNLGQQCAHANCKQLDFLPLHCKCGKQFCSEHFKIHVEQCEATIDLQGELRKITDIYKCSKEGCNETSLVPIVCQRCNQHFCIKHRHLTYCDKKDEKTVAAEKEKYAAPVRQFNEAKERVDKQIEKNLLEAKKKGKNSSLVNKVQLMKIKNKAKGPNTIPTADRVYFNVFCENNQGHPLFVSKTWSVGRAIDAIADECNLKNDNNKSNSKKLRLFKKDTNEIISKTLGETLDSLITKSVILDGENLIMAYVDDDQFVLKPE